MNLYILVLSNIGPELHLLLAKCFSTSYCCPRSSELQGTIYLLLSDLWRAFQRRLRPHFDIIDRTIKICPPRDPKSLPAHRSIILATGVLQTTWQEIIVGGFRLFLCNICMWNISISFFRFWDLVQLYCCTFMAAQYAIHSRFVSWAVSRLE